LTVRELEQWDEPDGRGVLVVRVVSPAGERNHLKNLGEQVLAKLRADRSPQPDKPCLKTMNATAAAVALGLRCGVDEEPDLTQGGRCAQ
jgi:hypothetical protein